MGTWIGCWNFHSKGLKIYLCQKYSSCFGRYFVFCLSVVCWNPYCSLMCHFTPLKITSDNSGGSKITGVTEYPQYAWNQVTNLTQLALLLITPLFPFLLSPVHSASQLLKKIERERKEPNPQGLEKQAHLGSSSSGQCWSEGGYRCHPLEWCGHGLGTAGDVLHSGHALQCPSTAENGALPESKASSRGKLN